MEVPHTCRSRGPAYPQIAQHHTTYLLVIRYRLFSNLAGAAVTPALSLGRGKAEEKSLRLALNLVPPTRFKFHPAPLHHPFGFMCCPSQVLVPRRALLRWRHLGRVVRWGGVGSPGRLRAAVGRSPEGVGCCFPMPRCPISPMGIYVSAFVCPGQV